MDLFNKNKIENLEIERDDLNKKLEAKEIENKCLIDRITDYKKMNEAIESGCMVLYGTIPYEGPYGSTDGIYRNIWIM